MANIFLFYWNFTELKKDAFYFRTDTAWHWQSNCPLITKWISGFLSKISGRTNNSAKYLFIFYFIYLIYDEKKIVRLVRLIALLSDSQIPFLNYFCNSFEDSSNSSTKIRRCSVQRWTIIETIPFSIV